MPWRFGFPLWDQTAFVLLLILLMKNVLRHGREKKGKTLRRVQFIELAGDGDLLTRSWWSMKRYRGDGPFHCISVAVSALVLCGYMFPETIQKSHVWGMALSVWNHVWSCVCWACFWNTVHSEPNMYVCPTSGSCSCRNQTSGSHEHHAN